jgi:Mg2+-importing ATPase
MSDEALLHKVDSVEIFSDMEPNQKERVILALKKSGKVVGYLGDGINDASAIHAADVGISVDTAVDVAKDAADIVLLEKNLDVLRDGVIEGRKTFRNTLKYIFITTSANFGNMITVAVASLLLPFLPMLPAQILLTNLITDIPAINIATDNVDNEQILKPGSWNIGFILRFVVFFGLISTVFDTLMFSVLLSIPGLSEDAFRTAWFMESTFTEILIILSMRTRKPLYKSMPSRGMLLSIAAIAVITMLLPVTPINQALGLVLLPPWLIAVIWLVTLLYILASELGKRVFFRYPGLSGLR